MAKKNVKNENVENEVKDVVEEVVENETENVVIPDEDASVDISPDDVTIEIDGEVADVDGEVENIEVDELGLDSAVATINGVEHEFHYITDLPLGTKLMFVDSVKDMVVGDDYYYPILKDMIFDFQLVNIMTDVTLESDKDAPVVQQLNMIDAFMKSNNVADVLKINLDIDMLTELYDCVDKAIEYKTGIHPSPIADGIGSILKTIDEKIGEFDMSGINDIARVLGQLQGDITPEKMLDAYANSDVFKKMAGEAVKKQKEHVAKMDAIMGVVDGGLSEA